MKVRIRALLAATALVALVIAGWWHLYSVSVQIVNATGRPITITIEQLASHSIRKQQSWKIEVGECRKISLHTKFLERSSVKVTSENGKVGSFWRPVAQPGVFKAESYTIHDLFLLTPGYQIMQDPPVTHASRLVYSSKMLHNKEVRDREPTPPENE